MTVIDGSWYLGYKTLTPSFHDYHPYFVGQNHFVKQGGFKSLMIQNRDKGMYNVEPIEQFSKHKRRLRKHSVYECLLNQSCNKYSQDTMCMESCIETVSS
jgi:hypothetical protein